VETAAGDIEDIVQCTIYLSDIALWAEVKETYGAFFSVSVVLPARTVVAVKEMPDGARVQVQAIARLKS
jgi:2-iminobutanoate/2-iminopropanoate deaminase